VNRTRSHVEPLTRGQETRVGVFCHVSSAQSAHTTSNEQQNYRKEKLSIELQMEAPDQDVMLEGGEDLMSTSASSSTNGGDTNGCGKKLVSFSLIISLSVHKVKCWRCNLLLSHE